MLDKLRKQIGVEIQQLNRLLEVHQPLLAKCANEPPNEIETSALAAMLHSFYTGIENIFKRIVLESGSALPSGEAWHRELLDAMRTPRPANTAVISPPLHDRLREYLRFRHVFRQAYSFELRWEKMASLVLECEETLQLLESELVELLNISDKEMK